MPFEALRLGWATRANDLNPVAALVMRATAEWPVTLSASVQQAFQEVAGHWREQVESRLNDLYVQTGLPQRRDVTYLWARSVTCPYCDGLVPLSPTGELHRTEPASAWTRISVTAPVRRVASAPLTSSHRRAVSPQARSRAATESAPIPIVVG